MDLDGVLKKAKKIASDQGVLADSPAERVDGRLFLCAGACIARALIETCNDTELLHNFELAVTSIDKFSFIPFVFEKHGLDPEFARHVIAENDLLTEPDRSQWFRSLAALC